MKKNGFTLIELIGVIIVLVAISLIVIPIVINPVRNTDQKGFQSSIYGIFESVRIDTASDKYKVPRLYHYKDGALTLVKVNDVPIEKSVDTDGKIKAEGYIYVFEDGSVVTNNIASDKYCGYNSIMDEELTIQENDGTCPDGSVNVPSIILKGGSPIYVGVGDTFVDPGVDARMITGEILDYTFVILKNGVEVDEVDTSYVSNYVIRYSASNKGEVATVDRIVKVIDMSPTIEITSPDKTYVKTKNVTISSTPVSPNKLEDVTYQINDGDIISSGGVTQLVFNEDGEYTITVNVSDNNGHTSSKTSGPYKIDTIAPTINVPDTTVIDVTEISSFDLMDGVTVDDNHPDLLKVTTKGEIGIIPGEYTVVYTVSDEALNTTKVNRKIKVIESDGPILSFQPSQTDGWVKNITVMITATDDSNITSFTYQLYKNDKLLENGIVAGNGKLFNKEISFGDSGIYQIVLNATDSFDNTSTVTSGSYSIDNIPPTITGVTDISIEKGKVFDVMSGVSATDNDNGSGVKSFVASPTTVDTSKAGVTTITYTAIDEAGNTTVVTRKVTVTALPPTVQLVLSGSPFNASGWASANFSVKITGVDNSGLGIKQVQWCNANSNTCTPSSVISSSSGMATVSVEGTNTRVCAIATDKNGASSEKVCTEAFKLDKKPAVVTAKSNTATAMENSDVDIASTYFTISKNGYADIISTSCVDTSNSNASVSNVSSLSAGNHVIKCTSTKANGLSGSGTITLNVLEAVASIGTTLYGTLSDAVAAVTNSTATTIKILKNFTQTSSVTIPANRNITIDLNGKTITSTTSSYYGMLVNNSNLELMSSVSGGTITSSTSSLFTNASTGTLKITSGTYSYTGTSNNAIYSSSTGIIQVNGGTITSSGGSTISNSSGTVNINGGIVKGTGSSWTIYNSTGTVNVSAGNVSGTKGIYISSESGTGNFTGGTITANTYSTIENNGTVVIDGATVTSTAGAVNGGYYAAIRAYGNGNITIKSGTVSTSSNMLISANGDGKILITGGNITSNADVPMLVNFSDTGTIEVQNGTFTLNGSGQMFAHASAGKIDITGGTFNITHEDGVFMFAYDNGTVNMSGGTITSSGSGFLQGSRDADTTGVINVTGGSMSVSGGSGFSVSDAGTINVSNINVVSSTPQNADSTFYAIFSAGGCTDTVPTFGKGTINVTSGTYTTATTMLGGVHENAKINITGGTFTTTYDTNAFVIYTNGTLNVTGGAVKSQGDSTAITTYTNGSWTNCYANDGANLTIGNKNASLSTTSPLVYAVNSYGVRTDVGTFNFYNGKIAGSRSYAAYNTSGSTFNTRGTVSTATQTIDGYSLTARYFSS